MAYYLDLFSPETYEAFSRSSRDASGFRIRQKAAAERIQVGDKLICYMTKLSRWVGILEVTSTAYHDSTPIFYEEDDPFVVRFHVKPVVWLDKELALPIREDRIWNKLSFTKGFDKKKSKAWTGKLRTSLNRFDDADAALLEKELLAQTKAGTKYPIDEQEYEKLLTHPVRSSKGVVRVTVPQDGHDDEEETRKPTQEVRESIRMQALLADIGGTMGFRIWIPRNDRAAVQQERNGAAEDLLDTLPLNYDDTTLKTIEQIDVLWLTKRSIVRAFEVEHTTSIYSGILRMADLLALQPNMDIRLHIVAPSARREKVFQELRRPVFSLLDRGPLYELCTYVSYEGVKELSQLKHLNRMSDEVVDDYAEEAD